MFMSNWHYCVASRNAKTASRVVRSPCARGRARTRVSSTSSAGNRSQSQRGIVAVYTTHHTTRIILNALCEYLMPASGGGQNDAFRIPRFHRSDRSIPGVSTSGLDVPSEVFGDVFGVILIRYARWPTLNVGYDIVDIFCHARRQRALPRFSHPRSSRSRI